MRAVWGGDAPYKDYLPYLHPTGTPYKTYLLELDYSTSRLIRYVRTSGLVVHILIGRAIDGISGLPHYTIMFELVGNSGILNGNGG